MANGSNNFDRWHRGVPRSAFLPICMGTALILAGAGGFGLWAAFAPLDGAVVASGAFVATGQNKRVQHLEGGIIKNVLVREGDFVEVGQPLIRLDTTAAEAKCRRLLLRKYRLTAMRLRLEAEINSADLDTIPQEVAHLARLPEFRTIYARQKTELLARNKRIDTEVDVLRKEILGLEQSITGYEAQAKATRDRLALFSEELKLKASLLDRKLVRRTEILSLRRAEAGLSGELGALLGSIADTRERIARAEQQIIQLRSAALQKTIEELREAEAELDDITEQLIAARDVLERTEVQAPVRGVVVKLNYHTASGVVGAGDVILELLPANDELVLEARVDPSQISNVKSGQAALVRLSALNQRVTPMIEALVVYLSADTVANKESDSLSANKGESFVVRVKLDDQDVRTKIPTFKPTPGMPADVFIKTGERTFFDYIMRPIVDSLSKAFKEQ